MMSRFNDRAKFIWQRWILRVFNVLGVTEAIALTRLRSRMTQPSPELEAVFPEIGTVITLGRLEPEGKVIQLTATPSNEDKDNRVAQLWVEEAERVEVSQVIAMLDSCDRS